MGREEGKKDVELELKLYLEHLLIKVTIKIKLQYLFNHVGGNMTVWYFLYSSRVIIPKLFCSCNNSKNNFLEKRNATLKYFLVLSTIDHPSLPSYLLTQNTDASSILVIQNINDTLTENKPREIKVG